MGTVGAYGGGGGQAGDDLRDDIADWLDRLSETPPADGAPDAAPPDPHPDAPPTPPATRPKLDPNALQHAVGLLRPRGRPGGGSDGPGGGGGGGSSIGRPGGGRGGGATRSAAASAASAGRAAAGAYAYATGDAATLAGLGLDYGQLRALGDEIEVVRRIVDAAFGAQPDSSIPDHEQRLVAADIADWVVVESENGHTPTPDEVVRRTIAAIITEAALVEVSNFATHHPQGAMTEQEVREAAEVLASQAQLSVNGVSDGDFAAAIEAGIETLRAIGLASG